MKTAGGNKTLRMIDSALRSLEFSLNKEARLWREAEEKQIRGYEDRRHLAAKRYQNNV